jgi:hypothetical protein
VNCQHDIRILTKEDAEFICRAVNSHDEMLSALKGALTAIETAMVLCPLERRTLFEAHAFETRAAIAKGMGNS